MGTMTLHQYMKFHCLLVNIRRYFLLYLDKIISKYDIFSLHGFLICLLDEVSNWPCSILFLLVICTLS